MWSMQLAAAGKEDGAANATDAAVFWFSRPPESNIHSISLTGGRVDGNAADATCGGSHASGAGANREG